MLRSMIIKLSIYSIKTLNVLWVFIQIKLFLMKYKKFLKYSTILKLLLIKIEIVKENLFYLRTSHGVEIDLIVDRKKYKELIEIKLSETFTSKMVAGIEEFIEKDDVGYLLYRGKPFPYYKPITVINYQEY